MASLISYKHLVAPHVALCHNCKPKQLINIKINSDDYAKTQVHTFSNTVCRLIPQTFVKICEIIVRDRMTLAFLHYAVQSQKQN